MARKKSGGSKKSRARKTSGSRKGSASKKKSDGAAKRSEPKSSVADADSPEPPESSSDALAPAEDVEEESSDAGGEVAEVISIDLDVDLDDTDARRQLIEEALAFVSEEVADAESGATDTGDAQAGPGAIGAEPTAVDAPAAVDPPEEPGPPTETEQGVDAVEPVEGGTAALARDDGEPAEDEGEPDGDDRPLIGTEAFFALSEIHAEGLASLPNELVLDLGEATTPEQRERLLQAALVHAEMQEAVYRIPTPERRSRRIKSGIAAAILLLAAFVAVRPPGILVPPPPPTLSEAERDHGLRVALLLQAQEVEAFRVTNGRLPASTAELDVRWPGIRLLRSNNRLYQLVVYGPDEEPVVYDSAAPEPEFETLARAWTTTRDSS